MINNPKLIEKIKEQIMNTTKEQLEEAILKTEEEFIEVIEYSQVIEEQKDEVYLIGEKYDYFYLHNNSTSSFLAKLLINRKKRKEKELEQKLELEAA